MLEKLKLNKQRANLRQLPKDEVTFIDDLKNRMDLRFQTLTKSYETFYQKERHQGNRTQENSPYG